MKNKKISIEGWRLPAKNVRFTSIFMVLMLTVSVIAASAVTVSAKTHPDGQVVGTTLFYVKNSAGQRVLVSQTDVTEMEADMAAGKIDTTLHNYSVLDRYVTTVHQEAQGFTVSDYVKYAQSKSTVDAVKNLNLTYEGSDAVAFWEMDDTDYQDVDTYTYNDLYGVQRYNFPLLYKYWNYKTQDYYDPEGKMTRDQVIDYIFANAQPETFLMSVRGYSQRYMVTDEKYAEKDYDMENYWQTRGLLDNARTLRLLVGMTEEELRNASPTASDTRYWVQSVLLDMAKDPTLTPLGNVSSPTASITSDADNYYVKFDCSTDGATIYYNQNFGNASYMPTMEYEGSAVAIPKDTFPGGTVTITAHAVKDGCTDNGVISFDLKSSVSGSQTGTPVNPDSVNPDTPSSVTETPSGANNTTWSDVSSSAWYSEYVNFVTENKLFDDYATACGGSAGTAFGPEQPMTRQMLVTALYRMAGINAPSDETQSVTAAAFTDVPSTASYAAAVAWANKNGIVNGMSATEFAPDASITREQITAMFYRYAAYMKADMSAADSLSAFTDTAAISSWALENVKWAVGSGMINGMTATTIAPQGTATRAQVAAMVQRLDSFSADK